jgi:hypothetical protein
MGSKAPNSGEAALIGGQIADWLHVPLLQQSRAEQRARQPRILSTSLLALSQTPCPFFLLTVGAAGWTEHARQIFLLKDAPLSIPAVHTPAGIHCPNRPIKPTVTCRPLLSSPSFIANSLTERETNKSCHKAHLIPSSSTSPIGGDADAKASTRHT